MTRTIHFTCITYRTDSLEKPNLSYQIPLRIHKHKIPFYIRLDRDAMFLLFTRIVDAFYFLQFRICTVLSSLKSREHQQNYIKLQNEKGAANQILINGTRYHSVCRLDALFILALFAGRFFSTIVAERIQALFISLSFCFYFFSTAVAVGANKLTIYFMLFHLLAYVRLDASPFERDAKGVLLTLYETIFLPPNK